MLVAHSFFILCVTPLLLMKCMFQFCIKMFSQNPVWVLCFSTKSTNDFVTQNVFAQKLNEVYIFHVCRKIHFTIFRFCEKISFKICSHKTLCVCWFWRNVFAQTEGYTSVLVIITKFVFTKLMHAQNLKDTLYQEEKLCEFSSSDC